MDTGKEIYSWIKDLFPICRSLTGNGVRETLSYLKKLLPELQIHEVPSKTKVFDWEIPNEWNINDAWIKDPTGKKIVDFKELNLHVLGYSIPVHKKIDLEDLQKHLYSLPDQPDAVPYVTSYYKERWGFCVSDQQRKELIPGEYEVFIDSSLEPGHLTYADLIIPGETSKEVLLSTYICHPSMANDELSGPAVAIALARWLQTINNRKYTYRLVLIPETIGSITYLSKHLKDMQKNTIAGFVLSCMGDNDTYSFLESRLGNSYADQIAKLTLKHHYPDYKSYSFLERGSDERQYCSPGVDLPVVSVMRSKYAQFPEYHTSKDNLGFISPEGLQGSLDIMQKLIRLIENNKTYRVNCLCEPQLGKRGLYPTISTKDTFAQVKDLRNFIAYADGKHDLMAISDKIEVDPEKLYPIIEKLLAAELIDEV